MEKRGALINRLQEQYLQQANESVLLNTALMLVAELQNSHAVIPARGGVSVILPYKPFEVTVPENKVGQTPEEPVADMATEEFDESVSLTTEEPKEEIIQEPEPETEREVPQPAQIFAINTLAEEKYNDVLEAVPTLAQQQPKIYFDLNDTAKGEEPSINDKLKQQSKEAVSKLVGEPIRDLKKGIGINDKYLFVKELFRNDETAYERSIKTINSFNILPEAEYWIQREMKYKLGWDDNNPVVQSFYQLVKRRFT